jgi:hypothetical protein
MIPTIKIKKITAEATEIIFLIASVLYFVIAFYFFVTYDISFRHKNRLSEAGVVVIVLFFMRYIALYYLLLSISVLLRNGVLSKRRKFILSIFSFGWLFALNGSFQVFYLFIAAFILVKPDLFAKNHISFKKIFTFSVVLPVLILLVLLVGIGNKVGVNFLFTSEGQEFLYGYIGTIAARSSTSLYSLAYVFEYHLFDLELFFRVISYEFYTLANRLSIILPVVDFDGEALSTVSRYNYLIAFQNHAERAGASPGFLASVIYAGGIPLGLCVMALYLSIVYRALRMHFLNIESSSDIAVLAIVYLIIPFFENPISLINFLQPPFLYFLLVVFISKIIPIEKLK